MFRFRIRVKDAHGNTYGKHVDEVGRKYAPGDELLTHSPLHEQFGEKFELLEEDVDPAELSADLEDKRGENVTADFPTAHAAGLLVFKRSGGWFVYDQTEQLNTTKLRKNSVAKFVSEQLEEE